MAVGGNGIIFNTLAIFYMTFVSMQASTTTRIGNLVGMKQPGRIPISIATAVSLSVLLSGLASLALQIWGKSVLALYTNEPGILEQAYSAKFGMVLSIVPYAMMMSLLGALRGAGQQTWGAVALGIAFYVIGLPASAFLALGTPLRLLGIWLGNALGLGVAAGAMGCRILVVNWEKVVKDSAESADLTESLHTAGAEGSASAPQPAPQGSIRLEA